MTVRPLPPAWRFSLTNSPENLGWFTYDERETAARLSALCSTVYMSVSLWTSRGPALKEGSEDSSSIGSEDGLDCPKNSLEVLK